MISQLSPMAGREEDPCAESYRPKPLPADQKPIDVIKKIANDNRMKWEMDLNAHGGKNIYMYIPVWLGIQHLVLQGSKNQKAGGEFG
jgi:hypothetical protein